jgi:hypothetical protein
MKWHNDTNTCRLRTVDEEFPVGFYVQFLLLAAAAEIHTIHAYINESVSLTALKVWCNQSTR